MIVLCMTIFNPFLDAFDHTFDIMVEILTDVYLKAKIADNNLLRSFSHCEENGTLASKIEQHQRGCVKVEEDATNTCSGLSSQA